MHRFLEIWASSSYEIEPFKKCIISTDCFLALCDFFRSHNDLVFLKGILTVPVYLMNDNIPYKYMVCKGTRVHYWEDLCIKTHGGIANRCLSATSFQKDSGDWNVIQRSTVIYFWTIGFTPTESSALLLYVCSISIQSSSIVRF